MRHKTAIHALGRLFSFWLGLLLFYWWLVNKVDEQQLIAAALVGLAITLALGLLSREAALHFKLKASWMVLLLRRLPLQVLRDLGLLAAELWRALRQPRSSTGVLKELPFAAGAEEPEARARRALVLAGISLPPNTVGVAIQPARGTLLVHELVFQSELPANREWPL